jgi:uncharacterized protein (TIGR02996 family)
MSTRTVTSTPDGAFVLRSRHKDEWGDFSVDERSWRLFDRAGQELAGWYNEGDGDITHVAFTHDFRALELSLTDGRVQRVELPHVGFDEPHSLKLREEIFAWPDDDAPRSVYADWLMKRGDARGELIALQLERSTDARVGELLERYGLRWRCDDGLGAPEYKRVRFGRGFIDKLELASADDAELSKALAQPSAACFRALELTFWRGPLPQLIDRLVACPRLSRLRHLGLIHVQLDDASAERLIHVNGLKFLESLDVRGHRLTERGRAGLARWAVTYG